jgi:hypothetical protein
MNWAGLRSSSSGVRSAAVQAAPKERTMSDTEFDVVIAAYRIPDLARAGEAR